MLNRVIVTCAVALWSSATLAQDYTGDLAIDPEDVKLGTRGYSPFVGQSFPNRVLWGETHLHTSYSTDAGMVGNVIGIDITESMRLFASSDLMTLQEACDFLGESESTIRREISAKKINYTKEGNQYLFRKADIIKLVA